MTSSQLETQIGSIAVLIYALLQGSKNLVPAICARLTGWKAAAANLLLAAVTVLATSDPGSRFSLQTLVAIALAASGAAGIHGTISKVNSPNKGATP